MDQPTAHEHSATNKPSIEITSGSIPSEAHRFALVITGVFFVIALIGILNHEMWRDEFEPWLIARNANSFIQLYENWRYEGHPLLWYLLLYILTRISTNPVLMQLLHISFATASVYLFSRFNGFSILQKTLFAFGYYSIYEYSVISRGCYALSLLLVLLFCTLYRKRGKNVFWLFVILLLLANTSPVFGLVLSLCLGGTLLLDLLVHKQEPEWSSLSLRHFYLGCLFFLLGVGLSVIQILPAKDSTALQPPPSLSSLIDAGRMKLVLSKISEAYVLIPEIRSLPYWVSNQSDRFVRDDIKPYIFISIILVIVATAILARKPLALLLYWTGTVGVICLLGLTLTLGPRHIGHLMIVFVAALCLAEYFPGKNFRNLALGRFSKWGSKIQNSFIILVFGLQVIAGAAIYATDLSMPFSASKEAAKFIRQQKLDTLAIVGTPDWATSDFSALLNTRIYYPERKEFGSFIIWDRKRKPDPSDQQIIEAIDTVLGQDQPQALLILNHPAAEKVADSKFTLDLNLVNPTIKLTFLAKFDEAMMFDEIYYLYLAQRVKS